MFTMFSSNFCTRPGKACKPKNATLAACALTAPGGSAVEVSGDEEKKVHVVLDGIVVHLKSDVAAAEKKHADAEKAFEEAVDELKKAKTALDRMIR